MTSVTSSVEKAKFIPWRYNHLREDKAGWRM